MKLADARDEEIQKLLTLKQSIKRFSGFGDDHHAAIDAQIWVIEKMTVKDWDLLDHARYEGWTDTVTDAAIDALHWLTRDNSPAPSIEWSAPHLQKATK